MDKDRDRTRINLSLAPETALRLKAYAAEHYQTVSQAITQWIWKQPIKADNGKEVEK